jgi:hypothetical protein
VVGRTQAAFESIEEDVIGGATKMMGFGEVKQMPLHRMQTFFFWGTMQNADLRCVWKSEARGGQPVLTRVVAGFVAHARAYILLE